MEHASCEILRIGYILVYIPTQTKMKFPEVAIQATYNTPYPRLFQMETLRKIKLGQPLFCAGVVP